MVTRLSDMYMKNYVDTYTSKLANDEETEEVESAKDTETEKVNDKKNTTDVWSEIMDTFSKSPDTSNAYLNYSNINKASDLVGNDLNTTILNVRKLVYGTQGSLIDILNKADANNGSMATDSDAEVSEYVKEKLKELKNK